MNDHLDGFRLAREGMQTRMRQVDALQLVSSANVMVLRNMMNLHLDDFRLAWEGIQTQVDAL